MTDNDKAPDLLSNERLLRMAEDDCAVVPRPLCREILRLRDELARAKHWSGADELTLDRNRLLTENATLTAELAKVTAERELHMGAAHRRLHELHAAQGALPPAIQRAEKAEAERDAARAEVERLVADARKVGEEMGAIARAADLRCAGCPGCSSFDCGPVPLLAAAKGEIERLTKGAARQAMADDAMESEDYAEMVLEDMANEMLLGGDYDDPEFDDEIEIMKVKTENGGAS